MDTERSAKKGGPVAAHLVSRRGLLGAGAGLGAGVVAAGAALSPAWADAGRPGGLAARGGPTESSLAAASTPAGDPWYDVTAYGADPACVADSTAAIQAAINAAQASAGGGVVFFPVGVYATSQPLVVTGDNVYLLGAGGLATNGGAGYDDDGGATIRPGGIPKVTQPPITWTQGNASEPACILFYAADFAHQIDRGGVERLSINGHSVPATMHGIMTYGYVGAWSVTGCIIGDISDASSNGINQQPDGSGLAAQGNLIDRNLVQNVGGTGFQLASGDLTLSRCHAQGCGANGISVTLAAGDTRISDCRGDLSGYNGFYIDCPAAGYLGMVQLSNCSTQRNANNGIKIANTERGNICPVYLTGCVFQGDGTAGSTNAGIRLAGAVVAVIVGCGVHVNTVDGGPYPDYAVAIEVISGDVPVLLQIRDGFYNANSAFSTSGTTGPQPHVTDVRVYAFTGHGQWQWKNGNIPSLQTTL